MLTDNRRLGNAGEDAAVVYLKGKGYRLLERNWTAQHHEVDIIMRQGLCLIFIEVKTRSTDFINPVDAIDYEKIWNLVEAWNEYRKIHPWAYLADFRIDAIALIGSPGAFQITHYEDPFRKILETGEYARRHRWHIRNKGLGRGARHY